MLGVAHRALAFPRQARRHAPQQVGRQRILYAAQKRQDARDKLIDDHLPVLLASPLANRFRARLRGGSEALIWDTGAIDGITANTEDAGHGKTLDLGVEDEFFHAEDARLEQRVLTGDAVAVVHRSIGGCPPRAPSGRCISPRRWNWVVRSPPPVSGPRSATWSGRS
ncbi:hypothetical protein [Salinispora arenicola]|uniref:hypothetical protein n=1 Tax=Salinispora arenicola TaxID=168697 RepID=UPI0016B9FEC4|nr:hypothetical protein [Salinispora arenicola]NIL64907.1 hypothetical protein [Salinispora arenicola]